MAQAKKSSKRKAPRTHKPKTPAEAELKPHKIVGQLIGARYNEHSEIVGEEVMGEVAIYRPNFSKVEKMVEQAVEEARSDQGSADKQ